jgi:hypothetical protein
MAMRGRRRIGVVVRLLIRGVLHRRNVAILILVVATAASAAAAVAPSYRAAAAVSALRARMTTASADESGVEVSAAAWPGGNPDDDLAALVKRLPLKGQYIKGISVAGRSTQLQVPDKDPEYAALTWREGQCAHVVFETGHCPTGRSDIALPVSAADVLDAKLGGTIIASSLDKVIFGPDSTVDGRAVNPTEAGMKFTELRDTVVGTFVVPPSQVAYWFGQDISAAAVNSTGTQLSTVTALVPRIQLTSLPPPIRANIVVDQPLDWSHVTPADVSRVLTAVNAQQRHHPENLSVVTSIPSLLRADAADRKQLGHLVTLAQLQLLLLVGLVLIAILAASMDRRRAELVIATLQGRRPRSTALSIAAEPVLLLAIGVIPGLVLSVPLAKLASHLWLRSGTPVHLTGTSVVDAVLVAAVAAVVTVVIAFFAAARPLGDQLAEDARSAGGRGGAWLDVIAITLAAAGLVELFVSHSGSTGDSSTPWSLLAPSLTGLAAGLALGRFVPVLLRPVVRATSESGRIGRFLAIRELRRDRAAWRVTAMVALALSLLTFAVTVNHGASTDRTDRAGLTVGAPTVVTVGVPTNTTLLKAVQRADPAGRWAMAAELLTPFGSLAQRTLAIDSTRLAAVAGWTRRIDGLTPTGIERRLRASRASVAANGVPLLTAGDVGGSTFGLNNEPLPKAFVYPAKILPVLLGQGAMGDLRSLLDVAPQASPKELDTTILTNQVWIGSHAPPNALRRLRSAGLVVNDVSYRSQVTRSLQRLAEPAGLSAYLAVAVVAAILAVALLIGTSVAAASRQRTETLALTSAGVPRSAVVRARASAAIARLTLAAALALGCGFGTAHLSARLIPETSRGAVPTPLLPLPLLPALIAVLIALVPAVAAEITIASIAAKRADAASLREALR